MKILILCFKQITGGFLKELTQAEMSYWIC